MSSDSFVRIQLANQRPVGWIAAFTALSWLGEIFHNHIELPQISPFSPENSVMAILAAGLFLIWWRMPSRRLPSVLLLTLGTIHLVGGGIISVLPFKFLPYYPEQSLQHYLVHILYGLAQLPLIATIKWYIRRPHP